MNQDILKPEVQDFINQHLKADITSLILKGSPFESISIQELSKQIVAKQKCEKKLPLWFDSSNIYYPNKLNIEQTSSEKTALYKADLIQGKHLIDITGGFGIDSFYFSKKVNQVTHCEINEDLSKIVQHNYKKLGANNIDCFSGDGLQHLEKHHFDTLYVDPSRRDDIKGKVFLLKDCAPNIPENIDFILSKVNYIMIKNSPLIDIKSCISELKFVKEIHIVALYNEVKELLVCIEKNYTENIKIKTINIGKTQNQYFDFIYDQEYTANYELPNNYLYEPNSAILKSGAFLAIAEKLELAKLHQHSHLYTSEILKNEFPGRKFKVISILPYHVKTLKKELKIEKGNITTRNFKISVADIRRKIKIKDGGQDYLFFTTDKNNKAIVIVCEKI